MTFLYDALQAVAVSLLSSDQKVTLDVLTKLSVSTSVCLLVMFLVIFVFFVLIVFFVFFVIFRRLRVS